MRYAAVSSADASRLSAVAAVATLWLAVTPAQAAPSAATLPFAAPSGDIPIDVRAEYSEFDRGNNRLVFRKLTISQGTLRVSADQASASPADFAASTWVFSGKVTFRAGLTEARCERAEMTFRDNQLKVAALRGNPAEFTTTRPDQRAPTTGKARLLEYDLGTATINMKDGASLADGGNEISGNLITYDLRRDVVSANGGAMGPVRIKIVPPSSKPQPGRRR